jgi:hypothetical protein
MFIFSLTVYHALLISASASKSPKAANVFEISSRYFSLPTISFNFLRLNFSTWNQSDPRFFTGSLFLNFPPPDSGQDHNLLPWMIAHQGHLNVITHLSECGQSDCVFPIRICSSKFKNIQCGNTVLLTARFLDVSKFTTLTPLALLISCKLSFPIVGL